MFGKSSYKQIALNELNSKSLREANKMPLAREGSLLNAINEHGLLTYTDFHFLLLLMSTPTRYLLTRYQVSGTRYQVSSHLLPMSTPTRYLDIIFHGFDISADGFVEAKVIFQISVSCIILQEFVHVLARISNTKVDPDQLVREAARSGLVRYLYHHHNHR